jgi:hypothetical protein
MNRNELIQRMALNAICDDYGSVDQLVLPLVAKDGARPGFIVERSETVAA